MSVHHVHGLGTLGANGQLVDAWSLGRDNAGRITAKTETVDGITNSYGYSYDTMGRLRTVTRNGSLVEDYQYDGSARRSYEFNSLRGTPGKTYDYSTEDHLLAVGDTAYQYDFDGFLTARTRGTQLTQYFYSSRGELLGVVLPNSTVVEYIDEPLGRRIAKKVNGVVVEKYLWQGMTRLLAVYDGSNNLVTRFLYADARMPVAMTAGGVTYYLGYDQVGTLRAVSDVAGNVVKRIDYDSFGNIINDTNPTVLIPFGFAGGLHDRDTGLVRFGYRDYDPDIGRWSAKDPIGFGGGSGDVYAYGLNHPVELIDPIGLQAEKVTKKPEPPKVQRSPTEGVTRGAGAVTIFGETGNILLQGGAAGLEAFGGLAQRDFDFYMQTRELGEPEHLYPSYFDKVPWERYGQTFEEAYRNFWNERMTGGPCP